MSDKWLTLTADLFKENSRQNEVKITRDGAKTFLNLKMELRALRPENVTSDPVKNQIHKENYRGATFNTNLIGEHQSGKVELRKKDIKNERNSTLKVSIDLAMKVPHFGMELNDEAKEKTKKK